jgi:signal transduction histidine kinase
VTLTIRAKIFLWFLALLALFAATAGWFLRGVVRTHLEAARQTELDNAILAADRLLDLFGREALTYAETLAQRRRFRESLEAGAGGEVLRRAIRHFRAANQKAGVGYFEVTDARGIVVAKGQAPDQQGEDRSSDPMIRRALAGEEVVGFRQSADGWSLRAVVPSILEDRIVGTVLVGWEINDALAKGMRRILGAEVAFLGKGSVVATSLDRRPGGAEVAPAGLAHGERDGRVRRGAVTLFGREFSGGLKPLRDGDDQPFGLLFIGLPRERATAATESAQRAVLLALVPGAVVALVLAHSVGRHITRPLARVQEGLERLARGEPHPAVTTRRGDEVGALVQAFNRVSGRLKGDMATAVAHETRNALGAIVACGEVLAANRSLPGELKEPIAIIQHECLRLEHLAADFLAFGCPRKPLRAREDLREVLEEALGHATLPGQAPAPVQVVRAYDPGLPPVSLDAAQMVMAFANLLRNAFQAMPEGGEVHVSTHRENGGVVVRIRDSGPGLPPGAEDRVFEPFYSTRPRGTGLGLPIVRRILETHGGTVRLEPAPGAGTVAVVSLPLTAEAHDA